MEYVCPYCGNKVVDQDKCSFCNNNLVWVEKSRAKSNTYYIKGYQEAVDRNLTGSTSYLKKAIEFNKYNIQARNLLGLIYFEMGKIGCALKEWIISTSLNKENNIAQEYIDTIQKSPKQLLTYKESIYLYNKALDYLKQGNEDMATIRLKKAISLNTKFVEAKVLLALCYIKDKQFYKANEQIKGALSIDKDHPQAMRYFEMISSEDTDTVQPYELEYISKQRKGKQVQPSRIIDRGSMLARYITYFISGALCMFVIAIILIVPNKTKNYEMNVTELLASTEELTEAMNTLKEENDLKIADLETKNAKLLKEKEEYETVARALAQKQKLSESTTLIMNREYVEAAKILYNVAPSLLSEEDKITYEELKGQAYQRATTSLCNEGYQHLNRNEWEEAKTKLEETLLYEPTEDIVKKSLYYLGRVEKGQNNLEKAKYYFEKVIADYPGTDEAWWSNSQLADMS